jgi:tetratricopeptide (TPR) repeat protein
MDNNELQALAEKHHNSGHLTEALDAYSRLCSQNPSDAQAWHMQAAMSGMLGQYQRTADCCEKAIALAPGASAIYTNYAKALTELARYADALAALEKAKELNPADPGTLILLGNLYLLMEDHSKAETSFRQLLSSSPDNAEVASNLSHLLMASGNANESAAICEQALSRNPENSQLLLTLIECYLTFGKINKCRKTVSKAVTHIDNLAGNIVAIIRKMHTEKSYALVIPATQMLIELFPEEYRFYLMLADSQIKTGNNTEAIDTIKRYQKTSPTYDAYLLLANAYKNNNDIDNVRVCLLNASRTAPDKEEPVVLLSQIHQEAGEQENALQLLEKFIEKNTSTQKALIEAGNIHYRTGNHQQAEHYYRQAIASWPEYAVAHNCLGMIHLNRKMEAEAHRCFDTAIKNDPGLLSAHCNLALLQRTNGNYEQAEIGYNKVLSLDPEYEAAIAGKAIIYERMGNIDKAVELVEPLIQAQTTDTNTLLVYASTSHKVGKEREAIELLERALKFPMITEIERMQIYFSLGKLLDRLKDYDKAFRHFEHGNKMNSIPFNRDAQVRLTDTTISSFSHSNIRSIGKSTNRDTGLLFIVGMPRSGTTLTEQILSAHPDVYGAGELSHIRDIAAGIPATIGSSESFPLNIIDITQELLDRFSYSHLQTVQALAHGEKVIIDKMPSNFVFLGLIELLFPNARVLHCVRDPMDTCLSCYFQQFSNGQLFSYDQSDLALYYQQYRRLMKHWKSTLSIPIMNIQYESLVQDTQGLSRKMLEFIGLDWHPACAEFHSSKRKVLTASYDQVRRPVYNSSIGRWKNYNRHLSMLHEELSEFYESAD